VTFNGVKSEGVVGADGTFSVTLPASPASTTPGILTVSSPVSPTVTLTDVVVGDVILCSVRVCVRVCACRCVLLASRHAAASPSPPPPFSLFMYVRANPTHS
jgi:hypothetical protein